MITLTFDIEAQEPLLLTRPGGDHARLLSYPYIPGSALRGALIHRYRAAAGSNIVDDSAATRLFFDGHVRYLNAYPLRQGQRAQPLPLTCLLPDRADPIILCCTRPPTLEIVDTPWQISQHAAHRSAGTAFRYQAIAPGERFGGAILCPDADTANLIGALLEADLKLGGARTAGYGSATVDRSQISPDQTEFESGAIDVKPGDQLAITLLSDLILRDESGPRAGAFAVDLKPDRLPRPIGNAVRPVTAYKRPTLIGGFSHAWGLPIDQAVAIVGGSVFIYEATRPVAATELRALELDGLGERRVEGFGRVQVSVPPIRRWHIAAAQPPPQAATPAELTPADRAVLTVMVQRLARRDLDRRLAEYVDTHIPGRLGRAPLARLRALAEDARDLAGLRRALETLTALATPPVGDPALLAWLKERADDPAGVWALLGITSDADLPCIGEVRLTPAAAAELARDYTLRLIAAVLRRTAQESL